MRGILLAGGLNTRMRPASLAAPKSLMPVWDSPLLYHSLCALMHAGARDILTIAAPEWLAAHRKLVGDGAQWGLRIRFAAQKHPRGIADAFRVGRDFVSGESSALALCDNIFIGAEFERAVKQSAARLRQGEAGEVGAVGAVIFLKRVADPRRFGVAVLDSSGRVSDLTEKPRRPLSSWAATGFYLCDGAACEMAARQKPSARGELEITDLLRGYMTRGDLRAAKLGAGVSWFDAGTPGDMLRASACVSAWRGAPPGSPELTALRNGWISRRAFRRELERLGDCDYARRVLKAGEKI